MKNILKVIGRSFTHCFIFSSLLFIAGCTGSSDPQMSEVDSGQLQLNGRKSISNQELQQVVSQEKNLLILDVRSAGEYESGHIPGAVNISHEKVIATPGDVPSKTDGIIVVYCESGYRANKARAALLRANFQSVLHLEGDMGEWRREGLPLKSVE